MFCIFIFSVDQQFEKNKLNLCYVDETYEKFKKLLKLFSLPVCTLNHSPTQKIKHTVTKDMYFQILFDLILYYFFLLLLFLL